LLSEEKSESNKSKTWLTCVALKQSHFAKELSVLFGRDTHNALSGFPLLSARSPHHDASSDPREADWNCGRLTELIYDQFLV